MIAHLLSTIPYQKVKRPKIELPSRPASQGYIRSPREMQTYVPDHAGALAAKHGHHGNGKRHGNSQGS
jgi:polyphosphate kinase